MLSKRERELRRQGPSVMILDGYVAREFLTSYVVALVVVLSLRVLLDLFVQFDEFIEEQDGVKPGVWVVVSHVVGFYWPKLFEYFRDFSGAMIVLGALFSLARLTRQNELTAVLASGISLKRVVAPIVVLAVGLNLVMVADQELVLPRLADKLVRDHDEMGGAGELRVSLLPDREGGLVTAAFDPETQQITDVWALLRDERGQTEAVLTAEAGRWSPERHGWELEGGRLRHTDTQRRETVEDVGFYLSDLSPEYLWLQRNSAYKSLMSSGQLTALIRRALRPAEKAEAISERHFRFTDPVVNMVMLLMGLPLIVSRERRKTKTAVALVAMGSGGAFVATFACKLVAGSGLDPFLAAALPIVIFAPLSVLAVDTIKT